MYIVVRQPITQLICNDDKQLVIVPRRVGAQSADQRYSIVAVQQLQHLVTDRSGCDKVLTTKHTTNLGLWFGTDAEQILLINMFS